jgi:hypothetical protein
MYISCRLHPCLKQFFHRFIWLQKKKTIYFAKIEKFGDSKTGSKHVFVDIDYFPILRGITNLWEVSIKKKWLICQEKRAFALSNKKYHVLISVVCCYSLHMPTSFWILALVARLATCVISQKVFGGCLTLPESWKYFKKNSKIKLQNFEHLKFWVKENTSA